MCVKCNVNKYTAASSRKPKDVIDNWLPINWNGYGYVPG